MKVKVDDFDAFKNGALRQETMNVVVFLWRCDLT
jgi:hypothetical protein